MAISHAALQIAISALRARPPRSGMSANVMNGGRAKVCRCSPTRTTHVRGSQFRQISKKDAVPIELGQKAIECNARDSI